MLPLPPPWAGFHASPYRFLWHEPSRTAVLADVHIGAHRALAEQGIFVPDMVSKRIEAAWKEMLKLQPRQIIINGDLFDDPRGPDEESLRLARGLLKKAVCDVTLLTGNHDRWLGGWLAGRITIGQAAEVAGAAIFHGDRWADARGVGEREWMIVGHQHPAVTVASATRAAKMHCFVAATVKVGGREMALVILPAFSPLPLGSELRTRRNWILDVPRPADEQMRILGLVESAAREPRVLDFGVLSGLPG